MKTAIVIVGHMRTFATCVHTLRHHVLRRYPDLEFFVSTVQDAQSDSWRLLKELYPQAEVHVDIVDKQPDLPEPKEPVRFEPYARSVPVQAVLRQLWQLNHAFEVFGEQIRKAEVVIRTRPDNYFHSFERPEVEFWSACVPWWGRFGGINDRFAVMDGAACKGYFAAYKNLSAILECGCPLHPESMIAASLQLNGCLIRADLKAEFSTLRLDGTARPPEISAIDIAHAALTVGAYG